MIRYVVVSVTVAVLAWYGTVGGLEWAGNLVRFYVWATLALTALAWGSLFLLIAADDPAARRGLPATKAPRLKLWLRSTVLVWLVVFLASHGWFITAAACLVDGLASALYRLAYDLVRAGTIPTQEPRNA